ncbi:DUF1877 family protein [Paraburkholderia sp. MAHUQ-67]
MIIPIFVAVSAEDFSALRAREDRAEQAFELIESEEVISTDIDKQWEDLREVLVSHGGPTQCVDGVDRWEDDPLTVVLAPEEVSVVATALTDFDGALAEEAEVGDGLDELVDFYCAAASRGDAVVIVYN